MAGKSYTCDEEELLILPEDSIHVAELKEVKEESYTWEGKTIYKLDWWWEIVIPSAECGPEFIGRRVKGSCPAKLTNRPGNKFREWTETLLGREIPVGMSIDPDELVGLKAEVVIAHQLNKKDASQPPWQIVSDVLPYGDAQSDKPPF